MPEENRTFLRFWGAELLTSVMKILGGFGGDLSGEMVVGREGGYGVGVLKGGEEMGFVHHRPPRKD